MNLEWWMVAVELHVNATYYVQHPALKSVYLWKKTISNMWVAVELHVNTTYYAQHPALKSVYLSDFSRKDSVSTSTESSRFQNKWFKLLLWETCLERSIDSYVKIGYLHHFIFMSSIIIISFRKAPILWLQLSREEHPHMESKVLSSPIFPICFL